MEIIKILEQVYDQCPTFRLWYARKPVSEQRIILRVMEVTFTMGQISSNQERRLDLEFCKATGGNDRRKTHGEK